MSFDLARIQKAVTKVSEVTPKDGKRPTAKRVHSLRTNARRLESELNALGLNSSRKEKRLLDDLAALRKRAGKIRDMDVLTSLALRIHPDGEQDCLVQLMEYLGERRKKAALKLGQAIRKRVPRVRRRLKRVAKKIEKEAGRHDPETPDEIDEAVAAAVKLSTDLAAPAKLTRKNLHPYRLKVKELRYVLQLSDQAGQQPFVAKLGEVKGAIGEWHDWEELTAIAREVLEHGNSCKLVKELRKASDAKFEHALRLAEQMRSTYLKTEADSHSKGHAVSNAGLSTRVLAAAAGIQA